MDEAVQARFKAILVSTEPLFPWSTGQPFLRSTMVLRAACFTVLQLQGPQSHTDSSAIVAGMMGAVGADARCDAVMQDKARKGLPELDQPQGKAAFAAKRFACFVGWLVGCIGWLPGCLVAWLRVARAMGV